MTQAPVAQEPAPGEARPAPAARQPVAWQAAPRLRRLATIAVAVAIAAVLTRHADLLLAGAPALAAPAGAGRGRHRGALPLLRRRGCRGHRDPDHADGRGDVPHRAWPGGGTRRRPGD